MHKSYNLNVKEEYIIACNYIQIRQKIYSGTFEKPTTYDKHFKNI